MAEEVKRLPPKQSTLRKLYLRSGNECAYPNCKRQIVNTHGNYIAQVCHIEAAEKGGERFNPDQTNEDRRLFQNLMLMCYEHHVATNDVKAYTVDMLKKMKSEHEAKFSDITTKIRESIVDHTNVASHHGIGDLKQFLNYDAEVDLTEDESLESVKEFQGYADKIASLPIPTRELLAIIMKRCSKNPTGFSSDYCVNYYETQLACDLDDQTMREHVKILDQKSLLYVDEIEGVDVIFMHELESGWPVAEDLVNFSIRENFPLEELIVGLKFDLLD